MQRQQQVSVVTGASSGIGREVARQLAARGHHVVLVARRLDQLQRTLKLCDGHGRVHVCDVSDRASIRELARSVRETEGRCDLLVNNAGFGARVPFDGPDAIDVLDAVMATNFSGAAYLIAELMDLLERSAPSSIVNVSSVAGLLPLPGASMYCASKFALTGLSESLAAELHPRGIRVAVVHPGPVITEGWGHDALARSRARRLLVADVRRVARMIIAAGQPGHRAAPVVPATYHVGIRLRCTAPWAYRRIMQRVARRRQRTERRVTSTT